MTNDHAIFDDGVLQITRTGSQPVLAIAGEIDESNYRGLVDTLSQLAEEHGEIHFDLAGLDYCDLAGLRAIVRLAGPEVSSNGRESRRVVLHAVPPQLKTVLGILGWDSVAGLAIDEPASARAPGEWLSRASGSRPAGGPLAPVRRCRR
jgi:anti-anti-sigma factor